MVDKNAFESILKRLNESIPPGLKAFQQELESLFRSVLDSTLSRLNLVTREEFDAQVKVLQKTRKKLESLDKKVELFEKQSQENSAQ